MFQRCLAMMFSSIPDAMDILLIETDRDRQLEDTEVQLLELTTGLLSMVIATPPVGTTEPCALTVMESGAPALTVEVLSGVVTLVEIVSAAAGAAMASAAVEANR